MRPKSYSPAQKILHWIIFALVLILYTIPLTEDLFPEGSPERDNVWWLHISFGLLLLFLVLWRVSLRAVRSTPAFPQQMSASEQKIATLVHFLLYFLLLAIPIVGIVLAQLRGNALSFFGLFTIPQFFTPNRELASTVKDVHELLATSILILAGIHALAAIWHHFYKKDGVLKRMLPSEND
ncbi:cytochrome b [Pseudochrobactrum saccharolyticum]|uniref:cytochrome b n=1 Tax=Pseudochrobactrum saccharolyticum TaxID=354352 RepID=UPI002754A313|nr:cytochrome b [Pseudochrobactrum saccharolyticum]MDP8250677.1 cytochrome b [Pseudochrobactrum saccharolyticum]